VQSRVADIFSSDDIDQDALLVALIRAHAEPSAGGGAREPIYFVKFIGGTRLEHPALGPENTPAYDEAALEELRSQGLISFDDSRRGAIAITPTAEGREAVEQYERLQITEPVADLSPLLIALHAQAASENPFAWPAVRPLLHALRDYWVAGGFSSHGIQLPAVVQACPDHQVALFAATIRTLIEGDYLRQVGTLGTSHTAAEVKLTDRARAVLDGWPLVEPSDLAQNLLAVLTERVESESDPTRKRRLHQLLNTVEKLGISVTGEILAKVITGGE
jgi:hypothetical protein